MSQRLVDRDWLSGLLVQSGLEAVIATSAQHVQLLTGYATWLEREMSAWMTRPRADASAAAGYAVTRADGFTGLVASPVCAPDASASDVDVVRIFERRADGMGAAIALEEMLTELGLSKAPVGVELSGADLGALATLEIAGMRDASLLLRLARMKKSEAALRLMRCAADATERGLVNVIRRWNDFADPRSLQRAYRTCLAAENADYDHLVYGFPGGGVSSGLTRSYPRGATTFVDAGARFEGMFSDTGLTLAHGRPGVDRQRRFDQARQAMDAGAAELVGGKRPSSVLSAMRGAVRDHALRPQAHGLGLSIREWPLFAEASDDVVSQAGTTVAVDQPLAPGMVVNLEVGGHASDGSSVQIEQSWIVTEAEPLALTVQDREQLWTVD